LTIDEPVELFKTDKENSELNKRNFTITIPNKTNELRRSNNDPFIYNIFNKGIEVLDKKSKEAMIINDHGYILNFWDVYCKCLKTNKRISKEKYFFNAISFYHYFLDVTTYFKKMIEIEIIKFCLFSKNEIKLISILSNPDFTINSEEMEEKLKYQYKKFDKSLFEGKIEMVLRDVLKEGRNNNEVNKLLQIVQNGNQILFDN
jgi:hypothetical protein